LILKLYIYFYKDLSLFTKTGQNYLLAQYRMKLSKIFQSI